MSRDVMSGATTRREGTIEPSTSLSTVLASSGSTNAMHRFIDSTLRSAGGPAERRAGLLQARRRRTRRTRSASIARMNPGPAPVCMLGAQCPERGGSSRKRKARD